MYRPVFCPKSSTVRARSGWDTGFLINVQDVTNHPATLSKQFIINSQFLTSFNKLNTTFIQISNKSFAVIFSVFLENIALFSVFLGKTVLFKVFLGSIVFF